MSNIGDPKEVAKRQERAKQFAQVRAIEIRKLCISRSGRDLLWWILEQGSPYASVMRRNADGAFDGGNTAYAAGWHDLAALIMQEVMEADPVGYVKMLTENRNVAELEKVMNERTDESNN